MSTDVKTSMLPVPSTESNVPVKRTQPAVRPDHADGRKFAEELSRGNPAPVKPKPVNDDQVKEAAERARDGVERMASQVAAQAQPTVDQTQPTVDQTQQAAEQVIPEGTLDAKAFRLAARKQSPIALATDAIEFLSGKLDKIDPSQISALVSDNEFITEAIAAKDLGAFMKMPAPVEKLLEALQIPEEIAATLQAAGLNLSDTIAPKDFFRALGVDPGRIHAELDLLKQNLPIDGVQPYIERAERMQGIRSTTAPVTSSAKQATDMAAAQQAAKRDATQSAAASMAAATAKASPLNTGSLPADRAAAAAVPSPFQGLGSGMVMNRDVVQLPATDLRTQSAMNAQPQVPTLNGTQMGAAPKMMATDTDPYTQMGKRSAEFVSIDIPKATQAPLDIEEALLQSQWKPGQKVAASNGTTLTSPIDGQLLNLQLKTQTDTALPTPIDFAEIAEEIDIDPQTLQSKSAPQPVNQGLKLAMPTTVMTKPQMSGLDMKLPIEELQLKAPQVDVQIEDFAQSDQSSFRDEGGEQFSDRRGLESLGMGTLASAARASRGEAVSFGSQLHVDSAQLSTADRAQVVQQLMDRALTMVRQGGGSMQIDFSGLNMGHLEMAISVAGDRVDIKMLTDSNQMRDVLSGDIVQLREALANQNMSLGSVDVGIDNSESDGEQMFSGQNFRQDADEEAKQLQRDFEDFVANAVSGRGELAERAEVMKRMPVIPPMNQQGTLAVRV